LRYLALSSHTTILDDDHCESTAGGGDVSDCRLRCAYIGQNRQVRGRGKAARAGRESNLQPTAEETKLAVALSPAGASGKRREG
jgi:hypothetical protein